MTSIPTHGGPYHESCNIDHHRETYGDYANQDIKQITIANYQHDSPKLLKELEKHCSHSAAFDSAAHFDPPRCAESTRVRIVQTIEEWINSEGDNATPASLIWLHGGAGVGKSALAQTLSEKFKRKQQLAASFFFFRTDTSRNNGDHLIPTLVSHLIATFEGIGPFVEDRIRKNRALFTKNYENQIQELLVEPLLALKSKGAPLLNPRLIVIDGLDECRNSDVQCELLRVIACAIRQIPYPFRFLITSRPEAHIMRVFNHYHDLRLITVHRYNLSDDPDADMDIRKFLEQEFVAIRRAHSGSHLPPTWPDPSAITSLVERSSTHFIYASTVIKYIRSPKHRPDDRLEVILRLRPPRGGDRLYTQLDGLYALIFEGVESHFQLEKICLVLGILYVQSAGVGYFSADMSIEELLEMQPGDLVLLLEPILSLVAVDGDKVRVLHKSLFDYFLDFTRGGHLPFDLSRVHESAATYILKQKIEREVCSMEDFLDFGYHCQHAYLNDALRAYLRSLDPKSVATVEPFSSRHAYVEELQQPLAIWHLFRALSREDFDSTGQVYEQYMAKWMGYLHSTVRRPIHHQSGAGVAKMGGSKSLLKRKLDKLMNPKPSYFKALADASPDNLKRELDTLLKEWKPQNFNPMDVGMDPRHVALIKEEQSVFSAHSKASFSGNANVFFSSLVFGHHYIHGYDLGIRNGSSFLFLRTYSRHGNTCHQSNPGRLNFVLITKEYLMRIEKYLPSDLHQRSRVLIEP